MSVMDPKQRAKELFKTRQQERGVGQRQEHSKHRKRAGDELTAGANEGPRQVARREDQGKQQKGPSYQESDNSNSLPSNFFDESHHTSHVPWAESGERAKGQQGSREIPENFFDSKEEERRARGEDSADVSAQLHEFKEAVKEDEEAVEERTERELEELTVSRAEDSLEEQKQHEKWLEGLKERVVSAKNQGRQSREELTRHGPSSMNANDDDEEEMDEEEDDLLTPNWRAPWRRE